MHRKNVFQYLRHWFRNRLGCVTEPKRYIDKITTLLKFTRGLTWIWIRHRPSNYPLSLCTTVEVVICKRGCCFFFLCNISLCTPSYDPARISWESISIIVFFFYFKYHLCLWLTHLCYSIYFAWQTSGHRCM